MTEVIPDLSFIRGSAELQVLLERFYRHPDAISWHDSWQYLVLLRSEDIRLTWGQAARELFPELTCYDIGGEIHTSLPNTNQMTQAFYYACG